jgi:hypothetical protein
MGGPRSAIPQDHRMRQRGAETALVVCHVQGELWGQGGTVRRRNQLPA